MPYFSLIIPVHNGGRRFRHCLGALRRSVRRPDEVIVVADGCRDGSARAARAFGATVIETRHPVGPAAARNLGAEAATGGILVFMDADVAFHRDTIGRIERFLTANPEVAAVFGNYDDKPPASGVLSKYKNLLQHFVHLDAPEDAFTFWAACGAIRRDVFTAVGGFDTSYSAPSIEDIELGYRLRRSGHRIAHRREIQATHLKAWTAKSIFMTDVFRRAVPWTVLIRRSGGFHDGLNIGWPERFKVAAVWAAVGIAPFAFFTAWAGFAALALLMLVIVSNARFFCFLWKRGGWHVALSGGLWHLFYHWYCGLGFVLGHVGLIRFSSGAFAAVSTDIPTPSSRTKALVDERP